MRKLIAANKYPAVLAFVSVAILTLGVLLRPEKADSQSVVSETETIRLQRMAEKRTLQDMTEFFSTLAAEAGAHIVPVPQTGAAGIVWDRSGTVVSVDLAGLRDPARPLVFVRLPGAIALPPAEPAPMDPVTGAWVLQVGRHEGRVVFTPGTYRGVRQETCGEAVLRVIETSISLGGATYGGGLFDLDGRLLGIVAPCGERRVVLPVSEIQAAREHKPTAEEILEKSWGARFAELDDASREYFRVEQGLLVAEVRTGQPAAESGLRPGDAVVEANGQPVTAPEELAKLASPSAGEVELSLVRNRRSVKLTLKTAQPDTAASGTEALLGLEMTEAPEGYPVGQVEPQSPAARAGIRPGDRLLEIDRVRLRRPGDVARLLNAPAKGPRFLVVLRGDRKIGVLVS